jgi:hypothetical protein
VLSLRRQRCLPMTEEQRAYRTRCKRSAEHFPLPDVGDAYENLHMLTILLTLALCRRNASSCTPSLTVRVPTLRLQDSLSERFLTSCYLPAMARRVLVMGDEVRFERVLLSMNSHFNSFQFAALLPSRATRPSFSVPTSNASRNSCSNSSSNAFRCSFRKSDIVRKSGWLPAANTRKATSSTRRFWILREENTPTQ